MSLHGSRYDCLRLNLPDLYKDPEFMSWLNAGHSGAIATWHECKKDKKPGEYSDIFTWYEKGEGSDTDMPEHCWKRLEEKLKEHNFDCGVVWIANLEV